MKKKIALMFLSFVLVFSSVFFASCGVSEIEKNWSNKGAWSQIYVYKGEGSILDMNWSESEQKGTATFQNTNSEYTEEYVKLYMNDSNYRFVSTGLPSNYTGNAQAYETKDGKLWVRIMWTNTSTFLLVRLYN